MLHQEIDKEHARIQELLEEGKLVPAIRMLRNLVKRTHREFLHGNLDQLLETYQQLMKYSFQAVKDPESERVYQYLVRSLYELLDELRELLLHQVSPSNTYEKKRVLLRQLQKDRSEAGQILESLTFDDTLAGILREVRVADTGLFSRQEALIRLFNIIWLSDKYTDAEISLLESVCDSDIVPWHDKALVVSALTLSLLRYFDAGKFIILFRFIRMQEVMVWERALIGVVLGFLAYNRRIMLYPQIIKEVEILKEFPDIEKHLEAILIQFTRSKATDSVSRKWEKEVLPEILKMRPRLEDKLDLDNVLGDTGDQGKNPDWETVFHEMPGLLDKLQEFTEMQMEGMDVFLSAFSSLKSFPFFSEISNWLVPFYAENPAVSAIGSSSSGEYNLAPLVRKLEETHYMCNSDKYSFCLNLALVPEQQKIMMMNMLNAEMDSMAGIREDDTLINPLLRSGSIFTQYFQDLYRFFKLHPWRSEFSDVFGLPQDLHETFMVQSLIEDPATIRNIAELYFEKHFYVDALNVFLSILEKDHSNVELFEKIAFCYEKTARYEQALDYYQKADLIDSDRLWIIRKLAYCAKMLNQWDNVLHYLKQAEKLDPDDLTVQAGLGQSLIHLQRHEEALSHYFKVEVLSPENQRIRRPLAWCLFLTGKLDSARDYLERLLADEPDNKHDLMNHGHVCFCMGHADKALASYAGSLKAWGDTSAFSLSFQEDARHLIACGVTERDIKLMLDYVLLHAEGI